MAPSALVRFIRKGNAVMRYHTTPEVGMETVGHHSCGVAQLVWILTSGTCRANLLWAALTHDATEHITGDIPYTAKRDYPALREVCAYVDAQSPAYVPLTAQEEQVLKVADMLDLWLKPGVKGEMRELAFQALTRYAGTCAPDVRAKLKEIMDGC